MIWFFGAVVAAVNEFENSGWASRTRTEDVIALPKGDRNDKVKLVEAKVEKMSGDELAALPDLDEGTSKCSGR